MGDTGTMSTPAAGWYPAPDQPGMRWWDGQQWTDHFAPPPAQAPGGIRCPHCGVTGQVETKAVKQKQGISGGKATGAFFTLGFSMLATGLSRKQQVTEMRCHNCGTVWHVA